MKNIEFKTSDTLQKTFDKFINQLDSDGAEFLFNTFGILNLVSSENTMKDIADVSNLAIKSFVENKSIYSLEDSKFPTAIYLVMGEEEEIIKKFNDYFNLQAFI